MKAKILKERFDVFHIELMAVGRAVYKEQRDQFCICYISYCSGMVEQVLQGSRGSVSIPAWGMVVVAM